jgi:hypothetical protein
VIARRDFLLGLAAAPLVAVTGGCGPSRTLTSALLGFYADRGPAATVGAAFLERFPDEDDPTRLVRQLAGSASRQREWESLAAADPETLHEALRAGHRADFAAGRIVLLRGWVLSQTEARLCALAARLG